MDKEQALSFLSKVQIFDGLTRKDLEVLLGQSTEAKFARGEVLISEGQLQPPFQVLCEGSLRVVLPQHRQDPEIERAAEVELNTLHRGACIGEYSLLDDMGASASVIGHEPGAVLKIPHVHFKNFLASDDRIGRIVYRNMLEILVGRLKRREGELDLMMMVR